MYPDALWIDLLDAESARSFAARPERLLEVVRENRRDRITVVIDEIQRVPELLAGIHLLIEEDKRTRFVLTGSSARKLKRAGVDLLAGRALLKTMHPFLACELGARFDLDRALTDGTLPLVVASDQPAEVLRSYAAVCVQEEVKQEGLVRSLGDFSRFLEVAAFSHGCEINASNMGRECMVGRRAVEGYISILQDLLLSFAVPAFTRKAERAPRARPKFYYFDAGVYRSLRPSGPMDRAEEIAGAALEGLVAQHLRAWIAYRGDEDRLHYWRPHGPPAGPEVDFVVYGPGTFAAIEVKNADRIRTEDLKGLRAFGAMYPQAVRLFVYRGRERSLIQGIHCLPAAEFLPAVHPARRLDAAWA